MDAVAAPRILGRLRDALGLKDHGEVVVVGPVRVCGEPNDYATDGRAHPFDFMEWPTVLECEATSGAPAEVVKAVTSLLEALWREGFKAVAACDFEDELPARGGMDRYPLPDPAHDGASVNSWWKNLLPSGRKRKKL
ncbi:hypothetical protein ACFWMT_30845 [Streptomyces sp. NPDC058368]|uniref:hypothetical protein n=1 Tax=Streptomyces sp. NPDC058368 TaxID=3346461 RepID=UPI00365E632F